MLPGLSFILNKCLMKKRLTNTLRLAPLCFVIGTALSGCVINVGGHNSSDYDGNVNRVFGSISVSEHRQVGSLTTVNGGITLSDNVKADELTTVNGGVTVGDFCEIDGITVVNGDIEAGKQLVSGDGIESVNGDIILGSGAKVDGSLITVNGDIEAADLTLTDNIETVNGDITISGNSIIEGDIIYDDPENNDNHSTPTLSITDTVRLNGEIVLERDVKLEIPDTMTSKVRYKSSAM